MQTNPSGYKSKHRFSNKIGRLLWRVVYLILFRPSPLFFLRWRKWLLVLFGAKLGSVWVHPTVQIWAPWLLTVGDDVFIDRDVNLYNCYGIYIGSRVVISSKAVLCTPSHDYENPLYPLIGSSITIEDDCWVCSEAFILPGVRVGAGSIVGARALVSNDIEPWVVVAGNPAKVIKSRKLKA